MRYYLLEQWVQIFKNCLRRKFSSSRVICYWAFFAQFLKFSWFLYFGPPRAGLLNIFTEVEEIFEIDSMEYLTWDTF